VFPIAYGVLLSSLFARLVAYSTAEPGPLILVIFLFPLVAGVFDWVENTLLVLLLCSVSGLADLKALPEWPIWLASMAALFKFVLLLGSLVGIPLVALVAVDNWVRLRRS
jgi:hypothetical protein